MDQLNLSQPFLTLCKAVIAALVLRFLAVTLRRPKYLPGPRGLPFFGNLFQIPNAHSWETYAKWRETYGDAIYVSALGSSIVVLNSYEACVDILEKRSNLYSDRPVSVVASHLMGWQRSVTLAPYTDRWRRFRKIMAQALRKEVVKQYWPGQEREIRRFLGLLIAEPDPERCLHNFRFAAGRNLLMSLYGIDVKKADDPIITIAEEAIQYATYATTPGTFLVDFFPILPPIMVPRRCIQEFRKEREGNRRRDVASPFNKTKADMKTGDCEPSFTSINLEAGEDEDIVRWCAGECSLEGLILQTVATIHAFLLAMVLYPDAQRRAQEELDTYVGTGRLPIIDDREDLPFVNAVMKEVMRWHPWLPLLFHTNRPTTTSTKAASSLLGAPYSETHERFNPDRFLPLFDKSIKCDTLPLDPVNYAFGFGRRGMDYADTMLFLSMASILSAFDVRPAKDEAGRDILPELKFNTNILREARPFKFSITPRPHAASVISAAQADL
ncbi:cytochrome P450 [Infundibulicybe gibba]|nr:cytochrome P450 [Infundibulicybe gibba]